MMKIEQPSFDCEVTASVGFVSPEDQPENFIVIHSQHKRGWDIPGGHGDPDETPSEAFIREVYEETNATILPDRCYEIARLDCGDGTGMSVFDSFCSVGEYSGVNQVASDGDIDDVTAIPGEEMIELYFGNKRLLRGLYDIALVRRAERAREE
jgi:8-oxo-dGTP pyrophosphatase MutT (NUDIX family)